MLCVSHVRTTASTHSSKANPSPKVSWRTPHDPYPGEFSIGFDPETALQLKTWRGGTQVWMRIAIFGTRKMKIFASHDSESDIVMVEMVDYNNNSISYSYRMAEGSKTLWMMVGLAGLPYMFFWEPTSNTWRKVTSAPSACWYLDPCGPNALFNLNTKALECTVRTRA